MRFSAMGELIARSKSNVGIPTARLDMSERA